MIHTLDVVHHKKLRLEESRLEVSGVLEEEEDEERSPGLQTLPEESVAQTPALDRSLQPMV